MRQVSHYHPLLVTLHWLIAFLIIPTLILGFNLLAAISNSDPQKTGLLRLHMAGGMLIFGLMVIRFILRMRTSHPLRATTGYPLLDRIAPITHHGFYVGVLLMVGTGLATAILAGLNRSVFQESGEPLPSNFAVYPTFVAHAFIATLLVGLIALHVLATIYHQWVAKDGLLWRMWFTVRSNSPQ